MSEIITTSKQPPVARCPIAIRLATVEDIPFMDQLQKKHQKQLGFIPRKTFEGKIAAGHVLVAEAEAVEVGSRQRAVGGEEAKTVLPSAYCLPPTPLGYVISQDKYMGHEELGIIYQMNIVPGHQRSLIGATLVKTVFERAAYGCRLFCCWCAQDIAANYFWESIGFVPLAFRAGNRLKARVHIFWQRRIREGDVTTPYWFPSETRGGMMNEARIVLPIPPGTSWRDAKPIVLPGGNKDEGGRLKDERKQKKLPGPSASSFIVHPSYSIRCGGLRLMPEEKIAPVKSPRAKRTRAKNDPKYVAAARELRDRYLEHLASGAYLPTPSGKYEVSRELLPDQTAPLPLSLPEAA